MSERPNDLPHPAFETLARRRVDSLGITLAGYRHRATGARHFHIEAEDDNNAFLVAFLTVPQDSTGVAHILEHTALCGSERYPVRDPFFMMVRRSLNTFMNAFTSSDWTAYPFATRNRKDFDNLLQVYLDAAFFPLLDALDFAQEGHRLEFSEPEDSSTPLCYRGVVYNEMKGAMSAPVAQLWEHLKSSLFPTVTYHYNSGGDPGIIPSLSHDQLCEFHRRHYHPSNAVFMTYGDQPASQHQKLMEERALSRFSAQSVDFSVPDERRYESPQQRDERYAVDRDDDPADRTHVVLGWLLGHSFDLREQLLGQLLSGVLLDNSASPLRYALETSDLGTAPSELCGVDDSSREMIFACGLEGSNPEHADAVEALILSTLKEVARDGVPLEQIEATLHQIELSQREIQSGGFPYGLRLMVTGLGPALHGSDPADILDIDDALEELRQAIRDPEFLPAVLREQLLENPHRVRLVMSPDQTLAERRAEDERSRVQRINVGLEETDRSRLVARARALKERQAQEDDDSVLPRVGLEDVPRELRIAEGETIIANGRHSEWYGAGTNGMSYLQVVAPLPTLPADALPLLPHFCEALSEVGSAGRDYRDTQARQAAVTGGLGARLSARGELEDVRFHRGYLVLSGKALARNQRALIELLHETWSAPRFDELVKLRELVRESRGQREAAVTGHGHALAMTAASAGLTPLAGLAHRWDGLAGLRTLKQLDERLRQDDALRDFGQRLAAIARLMAAQTPHFLLVGERSGREQMLADLVATWPGADADSEATLLGSGTWQPKQLREAWLTSTEVSFCAKAYPSVPPAHADAPALTVLGGFLRNGFLHRAIREQGGAYGAGASYDADSGAFRFFSYRDPRLAETLADFDRSLDWLSSAKVGARDLEEAILGVIGAIDRPSSPAGEAAASHFATLHGRTPELRRAFRSAVLEVSLDDLRAVAERYLKPSAASVAVVTSADLLEAAGNLGLETQRL
jgi:Zn-dependent M16 (insulinase) family peptidase